jgi:hypothetical protein
LEYPHHIIVLFYFFSKKNQIITFEGFQGHVIAPLLRQKLVTLFFPLVATLGLLQLLPACFLLLCLLL